MPMTKDAIHDRSDRHDDLVAAGEVIDLKFREGARTLSTRSAKLFHLLVKNAGGKVVQPIQHRVPISTLIGNGLGNLTLEEVTDCVEELIGVIVHVEVRDEPRRKPHVKSGGFLSLVERDIDVERGELVYEFSSAMRYVFERSAYWAVLDRRATLAFDSRYAIRLYELIALRSGLAHKHAETFALSDLRARFGVPAGKLPAYGNLRQKAIDPAVAEVNHVSPFVVSYEPIKEGRAVKAVRFTWRDKTSSEKKATKEELSRSHEGRKDRRVRLVVPTERPMERPTVASFPDSGTIRYGRWAEIVREVAPKPTPDVDLVANAFREFARGRNIPLNGSGVERTFKGYAAKFRVN